jgi:hypothetical protein
MAHTRDQPFMFMGALHAELKGPKCSRFLPGYSGGTCFFPGGTWFGSQGHMEVAWSGVDRNIGLQAQSNIGLQAQSNVASSGSSSLLGGLIDKVI